MYSDFYGMSERPFNVTPDPKFLYLNARYREAIASLNYGITQRKGFITLIGEAGTGKTTLLKRLLEDLDPKTKSVFIFNTNVTFEEILEYIFAEFDLAVHNGKKLYMLQRLNTFLLEELRNGGNVALLIDEAQDLEYSVLEDLRLLSNLETAKEKILQIVLSGQPELGQKLSNPILRQLRQRISINCRLLPLSRDEITEYLQFRLQAAGSPDVKLFTREAEERIYHFSRGVPRLVNVVCDNALVIGYALGKKRIGADIIDEAAADLLPVEISDSSEAPAEGPAATPQVPSSASRNQNWRQRLGIAALVLAAAVVGGVSVWGTGWRDRSAIESARGGSRLEVIQPGSEVASAPQPAKREAVANAAPPAAKVAEVPPTPMEVRDPRAEIDVREVPPPPPPPKVAAAAPPVEPVAVAAAHLEPAERPIAAVPPTVAKVAPAAEVHRPAVADPIAPPAASDVRIAAQPPTAKPTRVVIKPTPVAAKPTPVPEPPLDIAKIDPEAAEPVADVDALDAEAAAQEAKREAAEERRAKAAAAAAEVPEKPGTARLDGVPFAQFTVKPGDSVSAIAIQKYGQASPVILDLMKLANPTLDDVDHISVGQTLRLPQLSDGFPILNDGSGRYSLLAFSTRESWRAQSLRTALRGKGFDAVISSGSLGRGKPMTRVIIQGFQSREEVATAGQRLQRLLREDSSIAQLAQ